MSLQYYKHNKEKTIDIKFFKLYCISLKCETDPQFINKGYDQDEISDRLLIKNTPKQKPICFSLTWTVCTYHDTSIVFVWLNFQINCPSKGNFSLPSQGISYAFYKNRTKSNSENTSTGVLKSFPNTLHSSVLFKHKKHAVFQ